MVHLPAPWTLVYLLRDGRNAMVSYRYYREAVDEVKYDFLEFFSPETRLYFCHWAAHVNGRTNNKYRAHMLIIKYQDLLREPVAELRQFCEFAGVSRIAEAAEFRNLRHREEEIGFGTL